MFANHIHASLMPHERLHGVPDTVEEEDEADSDVSQALIEKLKSKENTNGFHQSVTKLDTPTKVDVNGDALRNAGKIIFNGTEKTPHIAVSQNHNTDNVSDSCTIIVNSHKETAQTPLNLVESSNETHLKEEPTKVKKKSPPHIEMEQESSLSSPQPSTDAATDSVATLSTIYSSKEMAASRKTSTGSCDSSAGSFDEDSTESSIPDFRILKSAMKRSCEETRAGKRRLSLFNTVMRRVSIHRRESTPTGRIATFLFGVDDPADNTKEHDDNTSEKLGLKEFSVAEERRKQKENGPCCIKEACCYCGRLCKSSIGRII